MEKDTGKEDNDFSKDTGQKTGENMDDQEIQEKGNQGGIVYWKMEGRMKKLHGWKKKIIDLGTIKIKHGSPPPPFFLLDSFSILDFHIGQKET